MSETDGETAVAYELRNLADKLEMGEASPEDVYRALYADGPVADFLLYQLPGFCLEVYPDASALDAPLIRPNDPEPGDTTVDGVSIPLPSDQCPPAHDEAWGELVERLREEGYVGEDELVRSISIRLEAGENAEVESFTAQDPRNPWAEIERPALEDARLDYEHLIGVGEQLEQIEQFPRRPEHPETGEPMDHYEWVGWLWCENEQTVCVEDYEPGEAPDECPECGEPIGTEAE